MQLPCLDHNISRQHIVQHHVLDEVVPVVLFVVILLDVGKGDCHDACILGSVFVHALHEYGVIRRHPGAKGLVGVAVPDEDLVGVAQIQRNKLICGADLRQVAAGDDGCSIIHNANHSVNGIAHLVNQPLK